MRCVTSLPPLCVGALGSGACPRPLRCQPLALAATSVAAFLSANYHAPGSVNPVKCRRTRLLACCSRPRRWRVLHRRARPLHMRALRARHRACFALPGRRWQGSVRRLRCCFDRT